MLLFHRGAARSASESGHAGRLLRRSGLGQGQRTPQHRYDHAGIYFFRSANPANASDLSRFLADAPPDPVLGKTLFGQRCSACHALDSNKFGPELGGIIGRRAGSSRGYTYSQALRSADFIWSTDSLDRWLTDPQRFVPGAKMPVRVIEATSRRDIIAYLWQESAAPSQTKSTGRSELSR